MPRKRGYSVYHAHKVWSTVVAWQQHLQPATRAADTVKPLLSGPLFSGHLSIPRNSLPTPTVNLTSFKRSPRMRSPFRLPNWLILLHFTSFKWSPNWIIMRYFNAIRSKSCPVSLTAHQTQHKTCNQCKNAFAWANRSVWVHHNLLQFLPYYTLYFRTTLFNNKW